MNTKPKAHEQYKSDFNYFRSGHGSPEWLDKLHLKGFSSFQETGFPVATKNNENPTTSTDFGGGKPEMLG